MVNNILERKKINLEKVVKKSNNLMNKLLILDLLNNDKLNNYIIELTHKKIYIEGPTIIKDGYLTEYEQFVYVLDNFISHFINIFNNIDLVYKVIPTVISDNKEKVLLSKRNYYDSSNIKYYNNEFNKIIISIFYNNILTYREELNNHLLAVDIDLDKINFEKSNDINKILFLLEELYFVNRNRYGIIALFEVTNSENYNIFLNYYELIFNIYQKNINFIKEYRKFKENNNMYLNV